MAHSLHIHTYIQRRYGIGQREKQMTAGWNAPSRFRIKLGNYLVKKPSKMKETILVF